MELAYIVCFRAQGKHFLPFCLEFNGKKIKKRITFSKNHIVFRKIEDGKIGAAGLTDEGSFH